jgi:hypothetical protein
VLEQYGEIGRTVAIDVAFDRCITVLHDVVQLALFVVELSGADEVEGVVGAALLGIGGLAALALTTCCSRSR